MSSHNAFIESSSYKFGLEVRNILVWNAWLGYLIEEEGAKVVIVGDL